MKAKSNLVRLCAVADVPEGGMIGVTLPDGHKLAVYNVAGTIYVTDDLCTHEGASLSEEGFLDGTIIECAWHFGAFDITTGEVKAMPCEVPLKTYAVTLADGQVLVEWTAKTEP
jgi:p-cumate 2,3-dioxygenase ferredoxin subunit